MTDKIVLSDGASGLPGGPSLLAGLEALEKEIARMLLATADLTASDSDRLAARRFIVYESARAIPEANRSVYRDTYNALKEINLDNAEFIGALQEFSEAVTKLLTNDARFLMYSPSASLPPAGHLMDDILGLKINGLAFRLSLVKLDKLIALVKDPTEYHPQFASMTPLLRHLVRTKTDAPKMDRRDQITKVSLVIAAVVEGIITMMVRDRITALVRTLDLLSEVKSVPLPSFMVDYEIRANLIKAFVDTHKQHYFLRLQSAAFSDFEEE